MKIGLDIDNVITAFDESILKEYFIEDKKKRNNGIVNPNGRWIKYQFDWSQEETEEFFNNNMEKIARDLKPRNGAKYYMDKLLKDGHELYLISHRAYPHYKKLQNTTLNWLKDNNINYTKLILSETTNKSKECLDNKIDVIFDDVINNCKSLIENGINCYLMETKYNVKENNSLKSIRDWKHLYNTICELSIKRLDTVHVT